MKKELDIFRRQYIVWIGGLSFSSVLPLQDLMLLQPVRLLLLEVELLDLPSRKKVLGCRAVALGDMQEHLTLKYV